MSTAHNRGVAIHYDVRGEGPPLVMIYGLGGDSADWWGDFPGRLARHFQLFMVDNRGTGQSDKPSTSWTLDDMAADVGAVVEDAGLEDFHLLGCSLGSMIARRYCASEGARIRSLALLCAPNGIQAIEEDRQQAFFWDPARPLIESARNAWPIIHPDTWIAEHDAELVSAFERDRLDPTPPRTFRVQMDAAMSAGDLNGPLNSYDWPVLVLHGDSDRLVPPANAKALSDAVPRARLEMLAGCSHNFWQHAPGAAAAIVQDFVLAAENARTAP